MANVIDLSHRSNIEDEASLWVARVERGLAPDEKTKFQKWITTSPQHHSVFMQFAEFWDITEHFQRLSIEDINESLKERPLSKPGRRAIQSPWFGAVAASVIVFVSVMVTKVILQTQPSHNDVLYSLEMVSQQESISQLLPDGSTLTLNAQSRAKIVYTKGFRNIVLSSGDLYIDVAHDSERPLTVLAKGRFFRAVGTEFSVSAKKGDAVELIVTEGSVMYGSESNLTEKQKSTVNTTAEAGVKVSSHKSNFKVSKLTQEELQEKLAWKSGILIFREKQLQDVLKEMTRYSDKTFRITNGRIARERITGRFETGDLESFLNTLSDNFDIKWHERDDVIVLSEAD